MLRYLRLKGLRVSGYIHDIIQLNRSYKGSITHAQLLVDFLHLLGFHIHPEKSELIPSKSRIYLGTQINTDLMQFRVPREKIRSVRREIDSMLQKNTEKLLTVRMLASMLGKLSALRGAVVSAQLHLWPLHHLMRELLATSSWEGMGSLDQTSIQELVWWRDQIHLWSGKTIIPQRSQMVLTTDASHLGWGGWWRTFGHKGRMTQEA